MATHDKLFCKKISPMEKTERPELRKSAWKVSPLSNIPLDYELFRRRNLKANVGNY